MKISLNKLIAIIIGVVVLVTIIIGVIIATNSKTSKNETNNDKTSISDETKKGGKIKYTSSFGGNEGIGTEEEFKIELDKSILPEDIEDDETACTIDGITWYYYIDSKSNANYLSTYSTLKGDVVIPSELDGHKVLSIGKRPSSEINSGNTFLKRKY